MIHKQYNAAISLAGWPKLVKILFFFRPVSGAAAPYTGQDEWCALQQLGDPSPVWRAESICCHRRLCSFGSVPGTQTCLHALGLHGFATQHDVLGDGMQPADMLLIQPLHKHL